jgi:plastocyanin
MFHFFPGKGSNMFRQIKVARYGWSMMALSGIIALGLAAGCAAPADTSPPEAPQKIGGTTKPNSEVIAPSPTKTVEITGLGFSPSSLTIDPGTTVIWVNQTPTIQSLVSGEKQKPGTPLDGKMDRKGSTYSYKFDVPGDYPYFDDINTIWSGTIMVKQP